MSTSNPPVDGSGIPPEERGACQEIRLAVVMYGGVSLAIYMNGIAQEILRLVRATAVTPSPDPWKRIPLLARPSGTETVYRRLGQILRRGGVAVDEGRNDPGAPIYTNFVVDVLSGTSAGGINAVFLAKALATDGSLDSLRDLWMDEADIALLVNDRKSVKNAPRLTEQDPPKSLLNSRRMYLRLVEAFDDMDPPGGPPKPPSPYVDRLDLFVTATDLHGIPFPIRLADGVVWERRHRNVFRFVHDWDPALDRKRKRPRNDFDVGDGHPERNRFLALACRATSAFPFAFEPMTLDQAVEEPDEAWNAFFRDQLLPRVPAEREAWAAPERRAFGDGGYLDNKPFSYAIDSLSDRLDEGVIPVDRKLLFVEPAPDRPEEEPPPVAPPDAIQNASLALLTLPRYETIREDLERVLGRNRLAQWVEKILEKIDRDVFTKDHGEIPDRKGFAERDLAAMVDDRGIAYGAYQRLKVYMLTDDLAAALAAVGGLGRDSEEFEAIRAMVLAWRRSLYVEHQDDAPELATHNRFLVDYDLPFRIRRLRFVRSKADALLRMDDTAWSTLWSAGVRWQPRSVEERRAFVEAILEIKRGTRTALRALLDARSRLGSEGDANPLYRTVGQVGIGAELLAPILDAETDLERRKVVEEIHRRRSEEIDRVMERLHRFIRAAADTASMICKESLAEPPVEEDAEDVAIPPRRAARLGLWYHYQRYEDYDTTLLPIVRASGLGEERDRVEVLRVSPQEAPTLIDERTPTERRRKLAGTVVFNFGAFLDRGWRRNDFLWGRLDGAERLISSVLPGEANREMRQELVAEAHRRIIREEIAGEDLAEVSRTVVRAVLSTRSDAPNEVAVRELLEASEDGITHPALEAVLRRALEDEELLEFFRRSYEVDRNVDRAATLKVVSRATRVIGRMFESLSDAHSGGSVRTRWVSRLAQVFWGLVEVTVPGSFANLVAGHVMKVLYAFEVTIVALAWILQFSTVLRFGLTALGITFGFHVVALVLEDFMRRRSGFAWWLLAVVGLFVVFLAAYGAASLFVPEVLPELEGWRRWVPLGGVVVAIVVGMVVRAWTGLRRGWTRLRGGDDDPGV